MVTIGAPLDGDLIGAHPTHRRMGGGGGSRPGGAPRARRNPFAIIATSTRRKIFTDVASMLALARGTLRPHRHDGPRAAKPDRDVRRDFPEADIEVMENRGRDVRPFLVLLERGRLDRYRFVCKVHGKKSSDGGRKSFGLALAQAAPVRPFSPRRASPRKS